MDKQQRTHVTWNNENVEIFLCLIRTEVRLIVWRGRKPIKIQKKEKFDDVRSEEAMWRKGEISRPEERSDLPAGRSWCWGFCWAPWEVAKPSHGYCSTRRTPRNSPSATQEGKTQVRAAEQGLIGAIFYKLADLWRRLTAGRFTVSSY